MSVSLYHNEQKKTEGKRWNCEKCLKFNKTFTINNIMEKLIQMGYQYNDLLLKY